MDEDLWSVEHDVVGFEGVERAFKTYLHLYREQLERGEVDAISDNKSAPKEVEEARLALLKMGEQREGRPVEQRRRWWQPGGDPQMAIELDLRTPEHFQLFETFGAYSINAHAYLAGAADPNYCINVHDSGISLLVKLDDPDAFRTAADLPEEGLVDLETGQQLAKERLKRRS